MDQLFKQTIHQDGQRGEADVVQRQVNAVIQSLGWTQSAFNSTPTDVSKLPTESRGGATHDNRAEKNGRYFLESTQLLPCTKVITLIADGRFGSRRNVNDIRKRW